MTPSVTLKIVDGIASIRLTGSEGGNAIGPAFVAALADAVGTYDGHPEVRCVLVTADGPHFTVGGDLVHFAGHADRLGEEFDALIGPYHTALGQLAALPAPVVCAVQGAVAGGGLGLLWCADVVLAADDLRLTTAFARLGLSGDGGSSWALPRLVGMRRATQLLLSPRVLGADEASAWGLVDRVVSRDALQAEAEAEARRYADGPTRAYAQIRRLLRASFDRSWTEQLAVEKTGSCDVSGGALSC